MSRMISLIKKNLLRFIRNPKTMGFLILIPVIYYTLLGLIFGGIEFGDTTLNYYVGWVDDDLTSANYGIHPHFNLDYFFNTTNEIEGINMLNYSSLDDAKDAALEGIISAYVYFPDGYESYLENRSFVNIAFWNNDTSTSLNYSILELYTSLVSTTYTMFKFSFIPDSITANAILANFNNYNYDGMLIINQNFLKGLDNSWNVNMSYLYRNGTSISKNYFITSTIQSLANNYFHTVGAVSNITIPVQKNYLVPNSLPFSSVSYEIYFLQTVSPAVQATIENILVQVFSSIINNNPLEIALPHEKKSIVGQVVNNITFSAPGYLLYGPMTILSFALVILTSEKKDGIYKRLASTEVKNYEIILSSIISNIVLIFMQFGIGAVILTIFGWNPIVYSLLDGIIGIIITMLLFSFLLLALAFALAPVFKNPDSAGGGVWIIIIPLAMVSGIFVPIELFGETMKVIAAWLPTRFAVVALQNILLNGLPLSHPDTLINLGLLALYSAIIFVIGIKAFNKFKR
ncbi:MAG: ABC transporter permease [Candidatus Thorarchaeota archaeon]